MPKLSITNTTRQFHDFFFRVPERAQLLGPISIPPGATRVVHDGSPQDIAYIIDAQKQYGIKSMAEALRANSEVNTLVYSVDDMPKVDDVKEVDATNGSVKDDRAAADRVNQSIAEAVSPAVQQANKGAVVAKTESEVIKQPSAPGDVAVSVQKVVVENK